MRHANSPCQLYEPMPKLNIKDNKKLKHAKRHAMPSMKSLFHTQTHYKPKWAQATQNARGLLEWVVVWMVIGRHEAH